MLPAAPRAARGDRATREGAAAHAERLADARLDVARRATPAGLLDARARAPRAARQARPEARVVGLPSGARPPPRAARARAGRLRAAWRRALRRLRRARQARRDRAVHHGDDPRLSAQPARGLGARAAAPRPPASRGARREEAHRLLAARVRLRAAPRPRARARRRGLHRARGARRRARAPEASPRRRRPGPLALGRRLPAARRRARAARLVARGGLPGRRALPRVPPRRGLRGRRPDPRRRRARRWQTRLHGHQTLGGDGLGDEAPLRPRARAPAPRRTPSTSSAPRSRGRTNAAHAEGTGCSSPPSTRSSSATSGTRVPRSCPICSSSP